jgi:hypothetical protein
LDAAVEFIVDLSIAGLANDHPALEKAREDFAEDASDATDVDLVAREDGGARGGKGFLQEYALIPTGPSAAWAIVQLVKLWLNRDRSRTVRITIKRPGQEPMTIEATGDGLADTSLEQVVHSALKR